jgi:hypothetical protein
MDQTSRDRFVDFLLEAKRTTFEYRDGDYLYRDIYFGMAYFVGQEVVFHRELGVWSMSYAGGVMPRPGDNSDPRAIYALLRLALRHGGKHGGKDEPYRGPAALSRDVLTYTSSSNGSLATFSGVEGISREGTQIYECRYAGGFLR